MFDLGDGGNDDSGLGVTRISEVVGTLVLTTLGDLDPVKRVRFALSGLSGDKDG